MSQFIAVGTTKLRPSFIHGFQVMPALDGYFFVNVYYDGSWLQVGAYKTVEEAWALVEIVETRLKIRCTD